MQKRYFSFVIISVQHIHEQRHIAADTFRLHIDTPQRLITIILSDTRLRCVSKNQTSKINMT